MSEPLTKENWITTKWRNSGLKQCTKRDRQERTTRIEVTNMETGEKKLFMTNRDAMFYMEVKTYKWIARCLLNGEIIAKIYTVKKVEQDE